jgi:uncharacterized protein (TIGR04206 family)
MRAGRRLGLVLVAGCVPWLVIVVEGARTLSLVFSFGFVSLAPAHVTPIWHYVAGVPGGLPAELSSWPVATFLYLLAVDSAVIGWQFGREDRRLTGGLLVVAGLSLLPVVFAVGRPAGVTPVALGTTVLWLVAWVGYRDALKRIVTGRQPGDGR